MDKLLQEIEKFQKWADFNYPDQSLYDIGWEWEADYSGWNSIVSSFEETIKNNKPSDYTEEELSRFLYIIARDNECETLAQTLSGYGEWFMKLCGMSLKLQEPDAKWQLAIRLKYAKDKEQAGLLLEQFVRDGDEYVSRRSLMELPYLLPNKVEYYAKFFWERDIYGEMQEYQRLAVLNALEKVESPILETYLIKAKEDGRKHLVSYVDKIISGIKK